MSRFSLFLKTRRAFRDLPASITRPAMSGRYSSSTARKGGATAAASRRRNGAVERSGAPAGVFVHGKRHEGGRILSVEGLAADGRLHEGQDRVSTMAVMIRGGWTRPALPSQDRRKHGSADQASRRAICPKSRDRQCEAKKPRAIKTLVVAAPPSLMTNGKPAPMGSPRKK
jgi:hypothetical protein